MRIRAASYSFCVTFFLFLMILRPQASTLFPYTTLFRSRNAALAGLVLIAPAPDFTEELMWKGFSPEIRQEIETNGVWRSEEHTSELQSHSDLVCRLLLEKKKQFGTEDQG